LYLKERILYIFDTSASIKQGRFTLDHLKNPPPKTAQFN